MNVGDWKTQICDAVHKIIGMKGAQNPTRAADVAPHNPSAIAGSASDVRESVTAPIVVTPQTSPPSPREQRQDDNAHAQQQRHDDNATLITLPQPDTTADQQQRQQDTVKQPPTINTQAMAASTAAIVALLAQLIMTWVSKKYGAPGNASTSSK